MFNQVFGTMLVLVSVAITLATRLMHQGVDSPLVAALAVAGVLIYTFIRTPCVTSAGYPSRESKGQPIDNERIEKNLQ